MAGGELHLGKLPSRWRLCGVNLGNRHSDVEHTQTMRKASSVLILTGHKATPYDEGQSKRTRSSAAQ